MVATTTVDGHVARAVEFQVRDDIYVAAGRQTPWDTANLVGAVSGATFNTDTGAGGDNTLTILIDEAPAIPYTVVVTFGESMTHPIASVISEINAAAGGIIASDGGNVVVLTSLIVGDGARLEITEANTQIGFALGETVQGSSLAPPPANPAMHAVEEVAGYKKADEQKLVVPDEDTAAFLPSPNDQTYDTRSAPDDQLQLSIDTQTITVTFDSGEFQLAADLAADINDEWQLLPGRATEVIASVSGLKLMLTSPTEGGSSRIDILTAHPELGFLGTEVVTGHAGGLIHYRDTQWREVAPASAFDEGARWVYLEGNLNYDEFPLIDYRQIGWYSGVVPAGSVPYPDPLDPATDVTDDGILEIVDNREVINRAIDEKEKLTIIIEF